MIIRKVWNGSTSESKKRQGLVVEVLDEEARFSPKCGCNGAVLVFTEIPLRESIGIPLLNNKPGFGRNNADLSLKKAMQVLKPTSVTYKTCETTFCLFLRVLGHFAAEIAGPTLAGLFSW